jgi:hypothetical protein
MKKSFYKTGIIREDYFLDKDTGELLGHNTKKHGYIANSKEEFLLIYSSLLGVFMRMEQTEIRVYGYLLRYANGIDFSISKALRQKMAEEIDLNERTIYNTIIILKQKNLIAENDKLYRINPRYAFKGSTVDRNNSLKAIIELGCKDC